MMETTRRRLLGTISSGGGLTALAGCQSNPGEAERESIEVMIENFTSQAVTAEVTALYRETVLFEHTYELSAGHADESLSVPKQPTRVRVNVIGGPELDADYSAPLDCSSAEVNVWIEPEGISLNNGCVSG